MLKVLYGKDKLPESMSKDEKEDLEMKVFSAIQFYLADEVYREVAGKDTIVGLWLKLENFYIPNSLPTSST